MILVKCNKCKRIAVEVSEAFARRNGFLEAAKECMCGNSYINFTDVPEDQGPPMGCTMEAILRRESDD